MKSVGNDEVGKSVVFEKLNSPEEINRNSLGIMGMSNHAELLEITYVHQVFFDYLLNENHCIAKSGIVMGMAEVSYYCSVF